jgi:hypothetical protein
VASIFAYLMLWTPVFEKAFLPWVSATTVNLQAHGVASQELGTVIAGMLGMGPSKYFKLAVAAVVVAALLIFCFKSSHFTADSDHLLGGAVVGLAVVFGWWLTGGSIGREWKEFAEMSTAIPSRVQTQSYTFISPMGDTARYLLDPKNLSLVNFGVMALTGVIVGSAFWSVAAREFRIEWFAGWKDFGAHLLGGAMMGTGGVLAMGCTIGQAVTGVSTLAIGSILAFLAIVIGSAATMKYQYWRIQQEG